MSKNRSISKSSGNVFEDIGFAKEEAKSLMLRSRLMLDLAKALKATGKTQNQLADLLGIGQSRVSDLLKGKVQLFSLDMLVTLSERLGKPVSLAVGPTPNPAYKPKQIVIITATSTSSLGKYVVVGHELAGGRLLATIEGIAQQATRSTGKLGKTYVKPWSVSTQPSKSLSKERYGDGSTRFSDARVVN